MKRRLVAILAVFAVLVLAAGAVVAFTIYQSVPRIPPTKGPSVATQAAYVKDVQGWPYSLPAGVGLPKTIPGSIISPAEARGFVSFYYQCSWVDAYLHGNKVVRSKALVNLTAWNALPVDVSSAENTDGSWDHAVLEPAKHGDDGPMKTYFGTCGVYSDNRVSAADGFTLTRPAPTVTVTPSATASADLCAGVSPVPCDPNFGPNATVDGGQRYWARGEVTVDAAGVPASYVVVSGDTYTNIAQRFGMSVVDLDALNCYNRDTTLHQVFVGDVINLDLYTVRTVGSEKGFRNGDGPQAQRHCLNVPSLPPQQ